MGTPRCVRWNEPSPCGRCLRNIAVTKWQRTGASRLRSILPGVRGLVSFRCMSRRGKFITFEGLDGTGKSTQMRKLAAALREAGHKVVETREPGGTATGEKIRKVLLDSGTAALDARAEMALMFASRAHHIAEVIEPGR